MDSGRLVSGQKQLDQMLLTLWAAGYVTLEPPAAGGTDERRGKRDAETEGQQPKQQTETERAAACSRATRCETAQFADITHACSRSRRRSVTGSYLSALSSPTRRPTCPSCCSSAASTRCMACIWSINLASPAARSGCKRSRACWKCPARWPSMSACRKYEDMPPGPLATTRLDIELLQMGLATPEQLGAKPAQEDEDEPPRGREMFEEKVWPLTLAEKLRLLFDATFPDVHSLFTTSGLGRRRSARIRRQLQQVHHQPRPAEAGRRHLPPPAAADPAASRNSSNSRRPIAPPTSGSAELRDITDRLTDCCRRVDPTSTDKVLEEAEREEPIDVSLTPESRTLSAPHVLLRPLRPLRAVAGHRAARAAAGPLSLAGASPGLKRTWRRSPRQPIGGWRWSGAAQTGKRGVHTR